MIYLPMLSYVHIYKVREDLLHIKENKQGEIFMPWGVVFRFTEWFSCYCSAHFTKMLYALFL